MVKRLLLYSFIIVVFSVQGVYLYFRGAHDGVIAYKQSKQFYMTLESEYKFGFLDGVMEARKHGYK